MIRFLLVLALLLPLFSRAQSAPDPVRIRFLFLDETSGDYFVKLGSEFQNLGSNPYVLSSPFDFLPGSRLELYKQLPDPETGELMRTRVVNLSVTGTPTHALAVIAPSSSPQAASDGTPNYGIRLYDVSPENTPDRSIRILNLSPAPMAARFGNDQLEISSGDERIVTPTLDKRSRIRVFVAAQAGDEWTMIFNSFLSLQEDSRMTGIVIYSPSGLRHTYTKDELETLGPPKPGFFWLYFTDRAKS